MANQPKKKATGTMAYIASWCLDVSVRAPSQEEVDGTREFLAHHHDTARLDDSYALAAFSLMARVPTNGERYFGDHSIKLLSLRNPQTLKEVTDLEPEIFAKLVQALQPAPSPKTSTKKVKAS